MIANSLVAHHSGGLLRALAPGVGRHGGRGTMATAMVGGWVRGLAILLPTNIACQVSAGPKKSRHPILF